MNVASSSKTLVHVYQNTWNHIQRAKIQPLSTLKISNLTLYLNTKEPIYMHRRVCDSEQQVPDCTCSADYFVVYGCREDHVVGPLCEGTDPLRAFQQSLQWLLTLLYILFPFSYQRPPTPLFTCRQTPPKMFILV